MTTTPHKCALPVPTPDATHVCKGCGLSWRTRKAEKGARAGTLRWIRGKGSRR